MKRQVQVQRYRPTRHKIHCCPMENDRQLGGGTAGRDRSMGRTAPSGQVRYLKARTGLLQVPVPQHARKDLTSINRTQRRGDRFAAAVAPTALDMEGAIHHGQQSRHRGSWCGSWAVQGPLRRKPHVQTP
jgi:hypothetical protein